MKNLMLGLSFLLVPVFAAANDAGDYDSCNRSIQLDLKPATAAQEAAYAKIPAARKMIADSNASKKATPAQAKLLSTLDEKLVKLGSDNDAIKKELQNYIGGSSALAKDEKAANGFAAMLKACQGYSSKLPAIRGRANSNKLDVFDAYDSASNLKALVFKNK